MWRYPLQKVANYRNKRVSLLSFISVTVSSAFRRRRFRETLMATYIFIIVIRRYVSLIIISLLTLILRAAKISHIINSA